MYYVGIVPILTHDILWEYGAGQWLPWLVDPALVVPQNSEIFLEVQFGGVTGGLWQKFLADCEPTWGNL